MCVDEQAATVEQAIETQRKAKQKVTDLEAKLHDAKGVREKELRNAENCVAKAKTKMEEASKKMKELHQVSVGEGHSGANITLISRNLFQLHTTIMRSRKLVSFLILELGKCSHRKYYFIKIFLHNIYGKCSHPKYYFTKIFIHNIYFGILFLNAPETKTKNDTHTFWLMLIDGHKQICVTSLCSCDSGRWL